MELTPAEYKAFQELNDREAIRDCVIRTANGPDRLDAEMWHSAYWPDAVEDHLWYVGNAHTFIDQTIPELRTWDATFHMLGQMLIRLDGEVAYVETYFMSYCRLKDETGKLIDLHGGSRYLDRMEKRSGEWRIAKRTVQSDWSDDPVDSADWSKTFNGYTFKRGTRMPEDPFYGVFGGRGRRNLVLGEGEAESKL